MSRFSKVLILTAGWIASCLAAREGAAAQIDPASGFARIVESNCLRCHNRREAKAGLDLSNREALLRGSDAGPVIVVGDPDASLLMQRVTEGSMPPIDDGPQLSPASIEALRAWIAGGAKWNGPDLRLPAGGPQVCCQDCKTRRRQVRHARRRKKSIVAWLRALR